MNAPARILVWDLPTRAFHWLFALSFAGAFVTAESERWRDVHVALGYTFGGLLVFRLVWGLIGTRYARFGSFAYGPKAVVDYLRSLVTRAPAHFVGHNPAGSVAIWLLLGLGALTVAAGWATFNDLGGKGLEEAHEALGNAMLAIVGIHVAGVIASSVLHKENLARAMVTGWKSGAPGEGIRSARAAIAVLLVAAVAAWWTYEVQQPPVAATAATAKHAVKHGERERRHRD